MDEGKPLHMTNALIYTKPKSMHGKNYWGLSIFPLNLMCASLFTDSFHNIVSTSLSLKAKTVDPISLNNP